MKSLSDILNRTPWWALVFCGLAVFVALAVLVIPFHLIEYHDEGATPEEQRAIKREVENTFAEGAMDIARSAILAMRGATSDAADREELDRALEEIETARTELRDAGRDVQRARREAERATRKAEQAAHEVERELGRSEEERKRLVIGPGNGEPKPPPAPDAPAVPAPPEAGDVPLPPLPPEVREQIRQNVNADLKKIGLGAGLILAFVPLFIVAVIAKIFIDRSRAAQRQAELKRKEADYHRMSRQVTEAKLMALQAQVEPHFLYNTLASVQALIEVDPARANTMVGHLIQYLRNALPKMRESISTVGQEIELVRAYLNILQMRMGRRLSFDISVPENLVATPFPPLMLPSLVENAIKHGLEPQREGGAVLISAQAQDGRLWLTVSDTGRGFGETVGAGVGLANIRERLAALYGETARLRLESNAPNGVIATIEVPLNGMRAVPPLPPEVAGANGAAAQPAQTNTTTGKVLSAVGTAERVWRKTLSFTFSALVVVAAVITGLLMVGVSTGFIPVQAGALTGVGGVSLGVAGIAIAFAAVVLALALVVAILYGLGWLFAGLAIFIPVVILIATLPATAPFILLALLIWWLVRRKKQVAPPPAAGKVEPVMQAAPPRDGPPAA